MPTLDRKTTFSKRKLNGKNGQFKRNTVHPHMHCDTVFSECHSSGCCAVESLQSNNPKCIRDIHCVQQSLVLFSDSHRAD